MPAVASLWRHSDFLKMWAGQTLAALSANVTNLALPLIAALALHASPFEMGFLAAAATIPNLLVGLHAGIVVDRFRRRDIMIATDLGRALLLLTVPASAALGLADLWLLYAVLFLSGVCTTFFEVANVSYLPSLVGRQRLVSANSRLAASTSLAAAVGPGLAGGLIQLLTAPLALIVDAGSLTISAIMMKLIRAREPALDAARGPVGDRRNGLGGVRWLLRDPVLRSIVGSSTIYLFFSSISLAVYVLYVTRQVGIGPGMLGLIFGIGGLGAVVGSFVAARTVSWLGAGPAMITSNLVGGLCLLSLPLAVDVSFAVPLLIGAQFGSQSVGTVFTIIQTSVRQVRTPDQVLGRMNASYRFLTMGTIPVGSLMGGALGSVVGLRATLLIGGLGTLLSVIWLVRSPARELRAVESEDTSVRPSGAAPVGDAMMSRGH